MQAKHGQKAAEAAGPNFTEPRSDSGESDDPEKVVRDVFGDSITWERKFAHHTDAEGKPMFVDLASGQVYDELPKIAKDGYDA